MSLSSKLNSWSCCFLLPIVPRLLFWHNFDQWHKYIKNLSALVVQAYISLDLDSDLDDTWTLTSLSARAWTLLYSWAAPSIWISALQGIEQGSDLQTMWERFWNSSQFVFLPSFRLLMTALTFPGTGYFVWTAFLKILQLAYIYKSFSNSTYLVYPHW